MQRYVLPGADTGFILTVRAVGRMTSYPEVIRSMQTVRPPAVMFAEVSRRS